jgi:hypothetical protein
MPCELGKCDYCGCPALTTFGGYDESQPPGHACDAHYELAFEEYKALYGHPPMIWGVMVDFNATWWAETHPTRWERIVRFLKKIFRRVP